MGLDFPKSYFCEYKISDAQTVAVIACDYHGGIEAKDIKKVVDTGYKYFYDVFDGEYDNYYVLCSKEEILESSLLEIDEMITKIENNE